MSKSLYNSDHRYTPEADALSAETFQALQPIFARYVAEGYSPREISHLMQASVWDLELNSVLSKTLFPKE